MIITDIIPKQECDHIMDEILSVFTSLGSDLDLNDPNTWNNYNLPVQTRPGLFQSLVPNLPIIWKTRTKSHLVDIFRNCYKNLRDDLPNDFKLISSNDGINIKHSEAKPFHDNSKDLEKDWAHIDQTDSDKIFQCFQGQLVLTNTTASFRCTPESHKYYHFIRDKYAKKGDKSNWLKFTEEERKWLKDFFTKKNIDYQIPIVAPAGSLIIWSSTTIHSAKLQDKAVKTTNEDKWLGWRGIIYVSYRPRCDFKRNEIAKKKKVIEENRVLNHWGNKTFPLMPGGGYQRFVERHEAIEELTKNPKLLYQKLKITPVTEDNDILQYIT